MKTVIGFFLLVVLTASAFTQTPQKISYQAVIRNSSNILVTNTTIGMQISILQGSPTGAPEYVEIHSPLTNSNGLATLEIGAGTVISGSFSSINWANGPYFIKTETDPSGGANYTISGTTEMLSVPYALFAKASGDTVVRHLNSGSNSELITSLPLTKGTPYIKRVIYSLKLDNISADEIIQAMCEFEVTNDLRFNVMIGSVIILADTPSSTTGIEITEETAFNVTPDMHHGVVVRVGTYVATTEYPTKYVNVIGYSASTASSSGDVLIVEQDYGRLSVLRFLK